MIYWQKKSFKKQLYIVLFFMTLMLFGLVNLILFLYHTQQPSFLLIKYSYNFSTKIMASIWLFIGLSGLVYNRYKNSDKGLITISLTFILFGLCLWGLRLYSTHIEPYLLKLRKVQIITSKTTKPFHILHISDIQPDRVGDYEKRIIDRINEFNPDLIIHTGDLLQYEPDQPIKLQEKEKLEKLFNSVHPRLGFWGVYGDVDRGLLRMKITKLGNQKFIRNEEAVIPHNGGTIRIFGLSLDMSRDDYFVQKLVNKWFSKCDSHEFTILCGHSPDFILPVKVLPIDLCLAGHTHGGQVRIPFYGPILTLTSIPRTWARGFRQVGKTRLNVSAGIGCEHSDGIPCIRFNCPPEMTLIKVIPKSEAKVEQLNM